MIQALAAISPGRHVVCRHRQIQLSRQRQTQMVQSCCFRYEIGGNLTAIDDPFPETDDAKSLERMLNGNGFLKLDTIETGGFLSIEVFASSENGPRWFLAPTDGFSTCLIEATGWDVFLDAIRHYSPLASVSKRSLV